MAHSILDDDGVSNTSGNLTLDQVVNNAIANAPSRRSLLKAGLGLSVLPFLGGLAACGSSDDDPVAPTEKMLGFGAVGISTADTVVVPAGYVASAFLPWGEPISPTAPAWKAPPGACLPTQSR